MKKFILLVVVIAAGAASARADEGFETPIGATESSFRRGDVTGDGRVTMGDAVFLLTYLLVNGEAPTCLDAGDTNDDGKLDLQDVARLLEAVAKGMRPLSEPFDTCGTDPTADDLACPSFPACAD
jgi:hypothetical protein